MNYLLYNPLSDNGDCGKKIAKVVKEIEAQFPDIEEIDYTTLVYEELAEKLKDNDNLIIAGGDGTLNFFANDYMRCQKKKVNLYLYPSGTGNDFVLDIRDREYEQKIIPVTKYFQKLPKVKINDQEYYFINNVGFGLDGEVCAVADEQKSKGKKVNYTSIALSLLMGKYERRNAKVTVDGVTKEYKDVWVCPTMNGRYYGGGMKAAPEQDRLSGNLTCPVMFGQSKLHTIKAFTGIFKGNHVKHTEMIEIHVGKHIKVEFDGPCSIQFDGEVIRDVTSYEAYYEE